MTSTHDHLEGLPELPGPPPIDDAVAEDLLAGRPAPAGLEPLAAVVRTLREGSRRPVQPTAELAAFLATGGAGRDRSATGLRAAAGRAAADRLRAGTKRGGTGLVAAGVAAAVVGFGSVGFAGSLPDPVQEGFETVVESVTSYQFPKRSAGDPAGRGDPAEPATPEIPAPGKGDPKPGAPKPGAPDERPDPGGPAGPGAGNGRPADTPGAGPPTERGDRDAEQPRGNGDKAPGDKAPVDQAPGDKASGRQNQPEQPGRPRPAGSVGARAYLSRCRRR